MKIYFSNSRTYFTRQTDPTDSLGGFMSSTEVPNKRLNSVFSDVSIYGKMVGTKECIAVFLSNNSDCCIKNLTIQQLYPNLFGKKSNQCKFEYAAVEPIINSTTGSQQMEQIDNTKDEPYNVEWFEPTSKKENAIITLQTPGQVGDVISILDVEIELTGSAISTLMSDIILGFEDNEKYKVQKINDTQIYFENKELEQTDTLIEIVSPGNAFFTPKNFSGYVDGAVLLVEELESKASIGLWIKRTVIEIKNSELNSNCEDLSNSSTNQKENIELIVDWE